MTEEEKKAIKTTKAILREWQKIVDIEDPEERDIEMSCYIEQMPFFEMKTLLKIIKKQEKEIEELKERLVKFQGCIDHQKEEIGYYKKQNKIKGKLLNTSLNETRKHCISKDKIRDKIKELEDYKKTLTHTKENEDVYLPQSYVIKQFKSLLGE